MFRGDCHQSNTITNYHIWWGISIYLAFFTQISRPPASLDTPKMQASLEYLYVQLRLIQPSLTTLLFADPFLWGQMAIIIWDLGWMRLAWGALIVLSPSVDWTEEQNELFWEYLMGLKIASSYKFISCIYGWNKAHVGTGQGQELLKSSNVH